MASENVDDENYHVAVENYEIEDCQCVCEEIRFPEGRAETAGMIWVVFNGFVEIKCHPFQI